MVNSSLPPVPSVNRRTLLSSVATSAMMWAVGIRLDKLIVQEEFSVVNGWVLAEQDLAGNEMSKNAFRL